jgi:dolichol-phosphate mannosyltransferase
MKKIDKKSVVILLPTYNERENIKIFVPLLQQIIQKEQNYSFSVLVIDDLSPDNTANEVKKLQKIYANLLLITGSKMGLGAAYIRGMEYATRNLKADLMFEMDSDLSHDPKLIPFFLREYEKGADFVVGSRYIKGGSIPKNWALSRKIFSIIGNLVVRYGLMIPSVKEWSSGYRLLTGLVYEAIKEGLEEYKGYTFQIASMHRVYLHGFRIKEVPLHFIDRTWGKSKFQPMDYIPNVLKYVIVNSSFIRFVVTGFIGFGVDFGIAYILITFIGMYEAIANMASAAVAVTTNFLLNNYWSFSYKKITGGRSEILKKYSIFFLIALGSILIQGLLMHAAITFFHLETVNLFGITMPSWIVFKIVIIAFVIIPYSYFMYNRFVWNTNKK